MAGPDRGGPSAAVDHARGPPRPGRRRPGPLPFPGPGPQGRSARRRRLPAAHLHRAAPRDPARPGPRLPPVRAGTMLGAVRGRRGGPAGAAGGGGDPRGGLRRPVEAPDGAAGGAGRAGALRAGGRAARQAGSRPGGPAPQGEAPAPPALPGDRGGQARRLRLADRRHTLRAAGGNGSRAGASPRCGRGAARRRGGGRPTPPGGRSGASRGDRAARLVAVEPGHAAHRGLGRGPRGPAPPVGGPVPRPRAAVRGRSRLPGGRREAAEGVAGPVTSRTVRSSDRAATPRRPSRSSERPPRRRPSSARRTCRPRGASPRVCRPPRGPRRH